MNRKQLYGASFLVFLLGIFLGIGLFSLLLPLQARDAFQTLNQFDHAVTTKFVAVDEQGMGVTANLVTEVRDGSGLILVNINDVLADLNTQYSARIAASVASNYTKISLENLDIIYNLQTEASIIGGQSAATVMAVSTIAALQNKGLRQDVIATGSVNAAGEVVDAGGLLAKAQAARNDNFSLLLVPAGLGTNPTEFLREKQCVLAGEREYCSVQYVGKQVSIGEEIGIEVREVRTVAEAWEYYTQ